MRKLNKKKQIRELLGQEISIDEIAISVRCSPAYIYKVKSEDIREAWLISQYITELKLEKD